MPGVLIEMMRVEGHCSCRGEGHEPAIWIVESGLLGIHFFGSEREKKDWGDLKNKVSYYCSVKRELG